MIQAESWSRVLAQEIVRPDLSGEVHSRFDRACNLFLAGHLISLVDPDLGNGPYSIRVPTPEGGYTSSTAWELGRTVSFQPGVLLLEGEALISLTGVAVWDPNPAPPGRTGDHAIAAKKLGRALQVLGQEDGLHSYVLAAWEGRAYKAGPLMVALPRLRGFRDTCLADPVQAVGQAMRLVGFGPRPGNVSAGDGFLAGLTATLVRSARWGMASGPAMRLSLGLAEMARAGATGRTTLVGNSLLTAAAHGWMAEAPSDLATGLLAGVPGAMTQLPRTLALGSGADIAGGIYAGLRILADEC